MEVVVCVDAAGNVGNVGISHKVAEQNVTQSVSFTHTPTSSHSPFHTHSHTHCALNYAALDHQGFTFNTLSSR